MSEQSSIEWTHSTWNPVTGCTEVSPGCEHCYARTFAERFRGVRNHPYEQGFDLRLWEARLEVPVGWKKPRRIFVNSMSDLFHKNIPDDFIVQVFRTMAVLAPQHTYQVLTKRPSRLVHTKLLAHITQAIGPWPAHIWLGVSVENQDSTWRVDKLRVTPAPIKFISAEPLLGPIQFTLDGIAWLIAGAESGHGARPMDEQWVRSLRDQATAAGCAFFYKQTAHRGRKLPLPLLDGQRWQQFPREVPYA
ncbi:MAG: phage Gp37/Gp68 family protein [Ktedonobacteraceae bacterium]|nr:phage Gp37/Gp68 family protein [Ktedonobacteraceae bacterium]